jgi:outer membrane protein assembly factor BamB
MKSPKKFPSIGWEWDSAAAHEGHNQVEGPGRTRYEFVAGPEPCVTRTGSTGWSTPVPYVPGQEAEMVADETRIYAALHSGASTGCTVVALDALNGAIVWQTRLIGLGSVGHSKYTNRVQIRLGADHLTVYGDESAGRYTEILDPVNGSRLRHEAVHD